MYPDSIVARFWSLIRICEHGNPCKSCCWEWQGPCVKGYGVLSIPKAYRAGKSHTIRVNRLCLELTTGMSLPPELHALHNCPEGDNPRCVNPAHLWSGTIDDNQKDSMRKGRRPTGDAHGLRLHPEACLRGETNPASRITTEHVYAIREYGRLGYPQWQIATMFPVSRAQIGLIIQRKTWKHLPERTEHNFQNLLGPIQRKNRTGMRRHTPRGEGF